MSRSQRSVARLAAIQALYQMEVSGVGVEAVIREFSDHRFDRTLEGDAEGEGATLAAADEAFFADLVRGVVGHQREIDATVAGRLAANWRLERLDATVRAILRSGVFELSHRPDVPVEVAINEYVELTKSFFDGPEAGFVNGTLDAVARDVRG
ncbi:N utilization substance protein B [Phenylobacterium haematophilum]|jgi:N utilization substance protein B|uniref:Transcription antitermination protein NusB n=1 Tax=Phenylobacterium haematophilum TaxID=98513 RepID=A0A839ZY61_9CAUL|nr:transcription antitermination factor NusB [Phenylobacterium haematophilum]MBB3890097.1 N utilization substance protein B [Phenylobacterium haematophilum]